MSKQLEIGRQGEEIARQHLLNAGYEILATNWHFHHYEIDIVARDGRELVIVEVKTRTGDAFEHPSEAVGLRKMRFLIEAAEAYIYKTDSHLDTRFDIIAIIFRDKQFLLEHYKDAFNATL